MTRICLLMASSRTDCVNRSIICLRQRIARSRPSSVTRPTAPSISERISDSDTVASSPFSTLRDHRGVESAFRERQCRALFPCESVRNDRLAPPWQNIVEQEVQCMDSRQLEAVDPRWLQFCKEPFDRLRCHDRTQMLVARLVVGNDSNVGMAPFIPRTCVGNLSQGESSCSCQPLLGAADFHACFHLITWYGCRPIRKHRRARARGGPCIR